MSTLIRPELLRQQFVERATTRFADNVPDFRRLRQLVADNGGVFFNDHGAIRTADPALCLLIVRACALMGLQRELDYSFPAKKLRSFDLQVIGEDAHQFKLFVSEVDLAAFPPEVTALIAADCAEQAASCDHADFLELLSGAEQRGGLLPAEVEPYLQHLIGVLMNRPGPPMRRSTLNAVASVSGEAASALALGPDFNHVTIDVRAAGFDGIEAMTQRMQAEGFRMLPAIQGGPDTKLRQTATMAATTDTPVREADGSIGVAQTERQFVEIIERGPYTDASGQSVRGADGRPLIFRNFLAANAEKIFGAASTRARPA